MLTEETKELLGQNTDENQGEVAADGVTKVKKRKKHQQIEKTSSTLLAIERLTSIDNSVMKRVISYYEWA